MTVTAEPQRRAPRPELRARVGLAATRPPPTRASTPSLTPARPPARLEPCITPHPCRQRGAVQPRQVGLPRPGPRALGARPHKRLPPRLDAHHAPVLRRRCAARVAPVQPARPHGPCARAQPAKRLAAWPTTPSCSSTLSLPSKARRRPAPPAAPPPAGAEYVPLLKHSFDAYATLERESKQARPRGRGRRAARRGALRAFSPQAQRPAPAAACGTLRVARKAFVPFSAPQNPRASP